MIPTSALGACGPAPEQLSGQAVQTEAPIGRCVEWLRPTEVGALDTEIIMESSGLEISQRFPDRLYHVNDSGDRGQFYVTDLDGGNTRTVGIRNFDPIDTEDMAVGTCGLGDEQCLFIADIGDNEARREAVEIIILREEAAFSPEVEPLHRLRIEYPEGPQDAEALAVDPSGNLYIVTKHADYEELTVRASNVYRIRRADWLEADGRTLTPERVARLDLTTISSDVFAGSLPTAADINDDGTHLLVLTYTDAFEFYVDLVDGDLEWDGELVEGQDYREIDIETLEQQESAAYIPARHAFMYETEFVPSERDSAGGPAARIMRVDCRG